ncbi:hypothetical protein DPMN_032946 [Dreissena polymorpha]|uniref:Uncharacterized protein n=1 Tax=Dreissena polymorpha TaxID=45954 RepID=A0A9D4RKR5_DREPO|nr:hypothetical protein DPMN_032946 [Dreissena polymorpha]
MSPKYFSSSRCLNHVTFSAMCGTIGYWTINVTESVTMKKAPPPGGHFHEDRTINVASRVKNAPPPGAHVFEPTGTIFEIAQDIIGTNLLTNGKNVLTKFHEVWTINVASRLFTRQIFTTHNTHRTTDQ